VTGLAKPNYAFEKRQKEIAKKKKQEEKRQRKVSEKEPAAEDATGTPPPTVESPVKG
jgi:hypothetical protein